MLKSGTSLSQALPIFHLLDLEQDLQRLRSRGRIISNIEKQADHALKICATTQRTLNQEYDLLLRDEKGRLSEEDLTKVARLLTEMERVLGQMEKTLSLFSKEKKAATITAKILQIRDHLITLSTKQAMLSEMKGKDSLLPEAFRLKSEIDKHLEKAAKTKRGEVIAHEFSQAIIKYFELSHLENKTEIAHEQREILNQLSKSLRLRMRTLSKKALPISKGDLNALYAINTKKKISRREVHKAQEVLIKLAIAEFLFPSVISINGLTNKHRKDVVDRFFTSFSIEPEGSTTQILLKGNLRTLKGLFETMHPLGQKTPIHSFEEDRL